MICSSVNLCFKSNLLLHGIGLQAHLLLNFGETPANGLPRDELIPIHSSFSECTSIGSFCFHASCSAGSSLATYTCTATQVCNMPFDVWNVSLSPLMIG